MAPYSFPIFGLLLGLAMTPFSVAAETSEVPPAPKVSAESGAESGDPAPADADTAEQAPLTEREQKLLAGKQAIAELEQELDEALKASLLAHQQYYSLDDRIQALKAQVPDPRPLEIVKVLVKLEQARKQAKTYRDETADRLIQLNAEIEAYRKVLAKAQDDFEFDFESDRELIIETRAKEKTADEKIDDVFDFLEEIFEQEEKNIKTTEGFIFNKDEQKKYIDDLRKIKQETNEKLDSLYDQWRLIYENNPNMVGSPPPPPPGYEKRRAQRPGTANGGQPASGGNSNPQPRFETNDKARKSQAENDKQQARELRKAAEETDDPVQKKIFLEQADQLDPPPDKPSGPETPPA